MSADARAWRVAVTTDEGPAGRLHAALLAFHFDPVSCPIMVEEPAAHPEALAAAAANLESYDWVACASARAVNALSRARRRPWPNAIRTAAVGPATAGALRQAGVALDPITAETEGAEALWNELKTRDAWAGTRVLVPTVPGGLRILAARLRDAGAVVDEVEAYRMSARAGDLIQADWDRARPDAVVLASPSAAYGLAKAIGNAAVSRTRAVVAAGPTTSAALTALGIAHTVSPRAGAPEVAGHLAGIRDAGHDR